MPRVASNSIARKLTWMNLLVSGTALVVACLAFLAYDVLTFRRDLVRTLSAQAQIVGLNSVSAIVFNDPVSATQTLSALRSSPNIIAAVVQAADGRTFATYTRSSSTPGELPPLAPGATEAYWFQGESVILARAILLDGKRMGTVYLQSDLKQLNDRILQYSAIAAIVLASR